MTMSPDLIASRYNQIPVGRDFIYSFETQDGVPIDGSNRLARMLSPFTLRLVPPDMWEGLNQKPSRDVNLLGRAGQTMQSSQAAADTLRLSYGIPLITGTIDQAQSKRAVLEQSFAAGKELILANGATRQTNVLADKLTAQDMAIQIERILNAPPLTLLINPNSMSVTYNTVQKFTDRTRTGFVFQRWGEAQANISFSGSSGSFIAGENIQQAFPSKQYTNTPTGVQWASKKNSAAYQNFMALYLFYRNNGYIYDTVGNTNAHLAIGAVAIDYDQMTYVGHIESFNYDYKQESPHRIEWSMEFICDRMFDTAGQPYGIGPMNSPIPNPATGGVSSKPSPPFTGNSGGLGNPTGSSQSYAQTPFALLNGRK